MSAFDSGRILICGANGLLGRSLCLQLAKKNYPLVLCDINKDGLAALAEEVAPFSDMPPTTLAIDIRDEASIKSAFSQLRKLGALPSAVINASYPRNKNYGRMLEDVTLADFSENIAWHLGGYFALAKHACLGFQELGGGSLVNISSIYGTIAPRFEVYHGTSMTMPVEYAAIKSGIIHITRYFAQYYKKSGIRANAISPGGIRDQQPESFLSAYVAYCGTKGMLDTSDLFGAVIFLISEESRYMTGQNLIIDDGFSL